MMLLILLAILVGPFVILSIAGRGIRPLRLDPAARARVGLSLFFAFAGIGHFVLTEEMVAMMPPYVPFRVELVYLTGVLELFAAIAVWAPYLRKLTGFCLILMLLLFLPVNIYAALNRIPIGGHEAGPVYLLARVPFQLFVIAWTYFATIAQTTQNRPG